MTRFLVTGASGLLGLNFALQYAGQHEVIGVVNSHALVGAPFTVVRADLSVPGAAAALLAETRPEVVINCAALAQPDLCEREPELTERLNVRMPGELAGETHRLGIRLAHISTDAVFDGRSGGYRESDLPDPQNTYARSKLAGEQAVQAADPGALVARVVFHGWSLRGQRSLSEFFYYNLSHGRPVKGFTDAIFSPLLVNDLARILYRMIEQGLTGLYHVFSSEAISKYEFGLRVARQFGLDESLIAPTSIFDGGLAARRSPNLAMNVDKLSAALGEILPTQAEGIEGLWRLWREDFPRRLRQLEAVPKVQ